MEVVSQKEKKGKIGVHQQHELLLKLEAAGLKLTGEFPNQDENGFFDILAKAGFQSSHAQSLIESKGNELAKRWVRFMNRVGFDKRMDQENAKEMIKILKEGPLRTVPISDSQKLAREIMGNNFFDINDAMEFLGVEYPKQRILASMMEMPFSEKFLEKNHQMANTL